MLYVFGDYFGGLGPNSLLKMFMTKFRNLLCLEVFTLSALCFGVLTGVTHELFRYLR